MIILAESNQKFQPNFLKNSKILKNENTLFLFAICNASSGLTACKLAFKLNHIITEVFNETFCRFGFTFQQYDGSN